MFNWKQKHSQNRGLRGAVLKTEINTFTLNK